MSGTLPQVQRLIDEEKLHISVHGYNELADDNILATEVIAGVQEAIVVEDYPAYEKGPCVLVLQHDAAGEAIHAVWGIGRDAAGPAVLITAYRPDRRKWTDDFLRRKP